MTRHRARIDTVAPSGTTKSISARGGAGLLAVRYTPRAFGDMQISEQVQLPCCGRVQQTCNLHHQVKILHAFRRAKLAQCARLPRFAYNEWKR